MNTDQKRKHAEYMRNWRSKKAERDHELKMMREEKLYEILAADPEMKWLMILLASVGIAGIAEFIDRLEEGTLFMSKEEKKEKSADAKGQDIARFLYDPLTAVTNEIVGYPDTPAEQEAFGLWNVVGMTSKGLAGISLSMLILGRLFGNSQGNGPDMVKLMGLAGI